jgi:hypothetical protein
MVLQIEATLNAETYFPGDNLYCRLTFSGKRNEEQKLTPRTGQSPRKKTEVESLDALTIYVGGYCAVEPSWFKLAPKSKNELSMSVELDPQKTIGTKY